ncbi:UDP-glucose--hexose-1-phosphate uridylyltransferase [Ornithinibacillus contaminans]|uniref:UDP-glucose--hexose-1-phosphate uridylyltransferase n=1 Tax=Ornithinibacillus contaminans TaxID=694055 RepID=UPI00064DCD80|nr:UDP-glucose--hexose-1-phosphate uridylyltransferase [Ornithinibacillus contaminans]
MTVFQDVEGLIQQALKTNLIELVDVNYVRNQVLSQLKLESFPETLENVSEDTIPNLLEKLIAHAIQTGVIEDIFDDKEILSANIMNCFVAHPSVVTKQFYAEYQQSPKAATDYFYQLSQNSNYIQTNRINKNVHFKAATAYGELDITINLSKPEKDPEQIKREREINHTVTYPSCLLCVENEGYVGRTGYPARANHRIIKIPLQEENWYFQYSPYLYYNEHSILLSEEHRNMKIDKHAFERLLTFTEKFPHYFIGSNADLPIVGGSILSHDHYQAGRYEFAMTRAEKAFTFMLQDYEDVDAAILNWPLSVIRLHASNKQNLLLAADHILKTWQAYNDEQVQIRARTNETAHNTITPIARMRDGNYELDLVLRNNRTTKQYPYGIFHPHEDVHHIKKENIGLIEVMGLAVLPARLKEELDAIKHYLIGEDVSIAEYHLDWATELKLTYGYQTNLEAATTIVQKELGKKFVKVLEDAGVFKRNDEGMNACKRFLDTLNTKRS